MIKKILFVIIVFSIVIFFVPVAAQEECEFLVVYEEESDVEIIEEILVGLEKIGKIVNVSQYDHTMLDSTEYVILLTEEPLKDALEKKIKPFCIGDNFLKMPGIETRNVTELHNVEIGFDKLSEKIWLIDEIELLEKNYYTNYKSFGYVKTIDGHKYSFGIMTDTIFYAPYFSQDNISVLALSGMLNEYFSQTKEYSTYIKFEEVYGFSDLEQIKSISQAFYKEGIPYIFGIMPQMYNMDYPAYSKFIDTINYCQSKNASIIFEKPLSGNKEMKDYNDNLQLMSKYGILVLDSDIQAYKLKYDCFSKIESSEANIRLPLNCLISYNTYEDWSKADEIVSYIKNSGISVSSYKRNTTDSVLARAEIEHIEDYVYKEEQKVVTQYDSFFNQSNKILTAIVLSGICITLILIVIGIRLYRKKFYTRSKVNDS